MAQVLLITQQKFFVFNSLKGYIMRHSLLLAGILGTFATPAVVMAEESGTETSPHSVTYNIGVTSQYIFRGLTQTAHEPALQGGVDYAHASGFYLGTWGSNVSWVNDGGYKEDNSMEWDVYGGYTNTFGDSGISYDVGLLQYFYPGKTISGVQRPDTTEIYGALSWGPVTLKNSYVISNGAFGIKDGRGSNYLDLALDLPIGETGYAILAHVGYQYFDGKTAGASNDKAFSYTDWKLGMTRSWDNGVVAGGYYTGSDTDDAWKIDGKNIGKDTVTIFVQKTF